MVDDGLLVTTNDSGDTGRVFTVDPATGETVGRDALVRRTRPTSRRWPRRAAARSGSATSATTAAERDSISVTRVPVGRGDRDVDVPSYELVYPDGPRDAESLLADPATGRLYVTSKGVFGGVAVRRSRAAAAPTGPTGSTEVGPVLADRDRRGVLPRRAAPHRAQLLRGGRLLLARARRGGPLRAAGPAAGRGHRGRPADGTIYASSEGLHAPVLRISLPPAVRSAMQPPVASPTPAPSVTPSVTPAPGNRVGTELPEEPPADRSAWGWGLGGLLGSGRTQAMRSLVLATSRLAAALAGQSPLRGRGRTTPSAAPRVGRMVATPAQPAPTSRAGPAAARARASSTSTRTASACRPRTPSGSRTW